MNWEPFERADTIIRNQVMASVLASIGMDPKGGTSEIYLNNLYQVAVFRDQPPAEGWPPMIHLSIKRRDKSAHHDWRHLQRIKNEIIGPEHEAVELYPAESRLVDSANQYHIYVLAQPGVRFPFGFDDRFVSNTSDCGTVQRPFPKDSTPPDCETLEQHIERKRKEGKL